MALPLRGIVVCILLHVLGFLLFLGWCPEPYMDETLHVPQAQRYCEDDWRHWDPKITTLPGTYVLSRLVLALPLWLVGPGEACAVGVLRCSNALLLGPVVALLAAATLREVHGTHSLQKVALELRVVRVVLLPLHFFFCFLYYTDCASTCFVLAAYWLHRRRCHRSSAVAGAVSVLVRQTNIVWVWCLAVHYFSSHSGPSEWPRRLLSGLRNGDLLPHAVVGFGFVAFLVWNKGIVVGDKDHHAAVVHMAMLPYFAAFLLFFLGPGAWRELLERLPRATPRAATVGLGCAVCCAAMAWYGSYAHPFLLADNRHVTFYLWKNLLRKSWARVLLLPAALGLVAVALLVPGKRRLTTCNGQEIALWALCCVLVLVPTPLLEFRYFVVPTVLALLHQPLGSPREEAAAVAVSAAINVVTVALFLFRPFHSVAWGPEPQRFMW